MKKSSILLIAATVVMAMSINSAIADIGGVKYMADSSHMLNTVDSIQAAVGFDNESTCSASCHALVPSGGNSNVQSVSGYQSVENTDSSVFFVFKREPNIAKTITSVVATVDMNHGFKLWFSDH